MTLIVVVNGVPRGIFPSRKLPPNWPDTPKQKEPEKTEVMEMPKEIQPVDVFGIPFPADWPEPPSTTQAPCEPGQRIRPIDFDSIDWKGNVFFL